MQGFFKSKIVLVVASSVVTMCVICSLVSIIGIITDQQKKNVITPNSPSLTPTTKISPTSIPIFSPSPIPEPIKTETTTPTTYKVYYRTCADARAAGVTPIYRGQPGYRTGLDRDGDGIACDK